MVKKKDTPSCPQNSSGPLNTCTSFLLKNNPEIQSRVCMLDAFLGQKAESNQKCGIFKCRGLLITALRWVGCFLLTIESNKPTNCFQAVTFLCAVYAETSEYFDIKYLLEANLSHYKITHTRTKNNSDWKCMYMDGPYFPHDKARRSIRRTFFNGWLILKLFSYIGSTAL